MHQGFERLHGCNGAYAPIMTNPEGCVTENPCVPGDKLSPVPGLRRLDGMQRLATFALGLFAGALAGAVPCLAQEPAAARAPAGNIVSVTGKVMIRYDLGGTAKNLRPALPGKEVYVGDILSTPSDGRVKLLLRDRSIMDLGPSSLFKIDRLQARGGGEREVDASLPYGSLRTGVTRKLEGKSHFKVRTPSATMGVRGTEFVLNSEMGDTRQLNAFLNSPPGEAPRSDQPPASPDNAPRTEVTVLQGRVEVNTPSAGASPGGSATPGGTSPNPTASGTLLPPGMQMTTGFTPPSDPSGRSPAGGGGGTVRQLDSQNLSEVASNSRVQDRTFENSATIRGTTREEESQASRGTERRDEPQTGGSGPQPQGQSRDQTQEPQNVAENTPESPRDAAGGRNPAGDPNPTQQPQQTGSGMNALTGALVTNLQTATSMIQTIRPMDVTVGAVGSTSLLNRDSGTSSQVPTLLIRFTPPPTGSINSGGNSVP